MDGGWNLYAMVGNDPVGRWDWLGVWPGAYNPYIHSYRHENKYKEPPKTGTKGAAKDWTYEGLRKFKKEEKEEENGHSLIPPGRFWEKVLPDTVKKQYCAYGVYTFGCKGITALLSGKYEYDSKGAGSFGFGYKPTLNFSEDVIKDCYDTYEEAKKAREKLCCSNGEYPAIIGINIPGDIRGEVDENGKYKNVKNTFAWAMVGAWGDFDFGFGLEDGSFVHATGHFDRHGHDVKVSKNAADFELGYAGCSRFLAYCVFCAR